MSIDPAVLSPYRDLMGDEADSFVADMIDSFLANSVELVKALDTSLAADDAPTFARSAHTLKSNSALFGAQTLAALCQELELAGKDNELGGLQEKLEDLNREYKSVCGELADLRRSLPL